MPTYTATNPVTGGAISKTTERKYTHVTVWIERQGDFQAGDVLSFHTAEKHAAGKVAWWAGMGGKIVVVRLTARP